MKCTEARDTMVVAELAELRMKLTTPLTAHLADCSECRARATSIANQTAHMAALVARRSAVRRPHPIRRVMLVASVPVAAAVILAVMIRARREDGAATPRPSYSLPAARTVSVDVAPGQQTAVLKTADSTVTVIWLTPGVGQ